MAALSRWLRSAVRTMKPGRHSAPARTNRVRLALEALETREVPTVAFTPHFSGTALSPAAGTTAFAQEEAASLKSPDLVIIFAGTDWFTNQGIANQQTLLTSIHSILNSPYLSALTQYGSDGHANFFSEWATTSTPPLTGDAGDAPGDSDLQAFINNQIAGMRQAPPEFAALVPPASANAIYLVINDSKDSTTNPGTHGTNFFNSNSTLHYAYVGAKGFSGTLLDQFTTTFSHELAESMVPGIQVTDPDNLVPDDSRQICDGEPESFGNGYAYRLNGAMVQAYWSQNDNAFIVPDNNSQTVSLSWPTSTFNGTFNLTVDGQQAGAKYTLDTDPVTFGQRLTVNNQVFSFDPGAFALNSINLNTAGGANTVNIKSVLFGESVSMNSLSSTSNYTVFVGNNGSLYGIEGSVSVANSSGGKTALFVDAYANPPTNITISNDSVTVGNATINYTPSTSASLASGVTSVTISDAYGQNNIDAQSAPAYMPVTVVGNYYDNLFGPAAGQVIMKRFPYYVWTTGGGTTTNAP